MFYIKKTVLPRLQIVTLTSQTCHVDYVEGEEVRITRQSHESGPPRGKLRGKGNIKKSPNARVKPLKAKIQYLPVHDNTFLLHGAESFLRS
jgi:hypothetical protein